MLKKIFHYWVENYGKFPPTKPPFGRAEATDKLNSYWNLPKPEKFFISTEELKMVGMALNHYKKHLQNRKDFGKIQQLADLDDRLFGFLDFLESSKHQNTHFSD